MPSVCLPHAVPSENRARFTVKHTELENVKIIRYGKERGRERGRARGSVLCVCNRERERERERMTVRARASEREERAESE